MKIAFGMPGGSEWVFIIIALVIVLLIPVLLIIFLVNNRELKKRVNALTEEKNALLAKLLEK